MQHMDICNYLEYFQHDSIRAQISNTISADTPQPGSQYPGESLVRLPPTGVYVQDGR